MSIEQDWKQLSEGQDDTGLSSMLQAARLPKMGSNGPLEKLKKNLLYNMIIAVIVCLIYVAVIVYFKIWQVQVAMGITLAFSLWALYTSYDVYQKINTSISAANTVLAELKRHLEYINNWIKTQQRVALYIYPVRAAGGFMLGGRFRLWQNGGGVYK